MSTFEDLAQRYIDAWNETDPVARRAAVDALYSEDARYVDPMAVAEGREAIAATIGAVQDQFPGFVFPPRRAGRRSPRPSPVRLGARTGRRAGTDRRVRRRRHRPSRPASNSARVPRQGPRHHLSVAGARPAKSAGSPGIETCCAQRDMHVVVAGVPDNAGSLDEELGRHDRLTLLGARHLVHPARVLLDDNPAVDAAEPAQGLRREPCPAHPPGQDLPTANAATRPDDLHVLGGEILHPPAITAVDRIQPCFDDSEGPEAHGASVEAAGSAASPFPSDHIGFAELERAGVVVGLSRVRMAPRRRQDR